MHVSRGMPEKRRQAHIRTALGGGEEAGEETAVAGRTATLGPSPLDDAVVFGPEAELDDIPLGNLDGIRAEGEPKSADRDGDGGRLGLEGQRSNAHEAGKHGVS